MSPNSKGKQDSDVAEDGGSKQDKAPKAHLVTWRYDDDRTIGGVLKGNEGYFHPTLLKSELDLNKEISWLKRQEENKRLRLRPFKEIDLPIGVEAFSEDYHEFSIGNPTITRKHFDEFRKMTDARDQEARGAMMQIVSSVLSGYVVRLIGEANFVIDEFVEECVRPLNVHVSAATNVTYTLHELIEAMVVDTAVDEEDNLRFHSERIFPAPGTSAKKMLDTAYMGFKGYKEYVWPMPYRDTAVLIDRNYISPAEINMFAIRNPWCACIIYGGKVALPVGLPIEVKGSALSRANDLFDRKAVQALVAAYVAEVPKLFKMGERWLTPIWKEAGERLSTPVYEPSPDILRPCILLVHSAPMRCVERGDGGVYPKAAECDLSRLYAGVDICFTRRSDDIVSGGCIGACAGNDAVRGEYRTFLLRTAETWSNMADAYGGRRSYLGICQML